VVAVGATALESISTQDDRLALVAELRLRAPKVRSVSIETLARHARLAPFSRNERLPVEPLVTLVLAGCLAAVRAHPSGGRRMIGIATPGDLVGLLSLGASDSCCELVGSPPESQLGGLVTSSSPSPNRTPSSPYWSRERGWNAAGSWRACWTSRPSPR